MATLTPSAKQQFFDANGNPLAGGKLYTYAAGTTTPLATYTDSSGGTPNTNPVILDSRGEANIWLGSAVYKFKLTTSADSEIWTVDNIASYNYDVLAALAASGGSSLVGFLQSGSGATARTTQSKLRDVVSVKDFGAVGDGTGNDSTAIQAAIDYAKSNNIGAVLFPSGNYRITSSLYVRGDFGYKGIELRGENATITQTANAVALYIDPTNPSPAPEYRIRALVQGLYFNGPGVANTSSVGVQCQNGANIEVRDCIIRNFYRGLYGSGCLISRFENLALNKNYYGIQFENTVTFAPNDVHFYKCYVWDNTVAIRCINFPNGAITFDGCEVEGNNLSGNTTDGIRVTEFFNAGKVTLKGCHFEENPGQYNIFFDGNANAHLTVIGCEIIPGDSAGTVLYMDNATGASSLTVIGSRVTNNVQQIYLSTGVKAFLIGTFAGSLAGNVSKVMWMQDSRLALGRIDPLAGGTGIVFPATQNASTDPNTLDDYKEGTWEPTIIGTSTAGTATYAYQNARYTKIGRQVFVEAFVSWSGGTGTGDLAISGLPFTVSGALTYPAATIGRMNNISLTAGATPCANFEPNTSRILFLQIPSGGGAAATIAYDAAGYIMVSGSYTV